MGTIPISLNDTQYRNNPEPTALPQNFGMNRFAAVQERAQVIGKIGGQAMDIATQYAAKNKAADLRADSLAAQAEMAAITADADEQAKATTDPAKIRQIWDDAHVRYTEYVTGVSKKEGREGVPNIRWGEQKKEFISSSDAALSQFRTRGQSRIADVGRQASNATFLQTIHDGEQAGDYKLIEQGIAGLTENGTLTAEAAQLKRSEAFARTDTLAVKTNLAAIENMDLAKAKEARDALVDGLRAKEKDDSFSAFQHLDPPDREEYVARANVAVERVQKRVEGAEIDRYLKDAVADPDMVTWSAAKVEKVYPSLPDKVKLKLRSDEAAAKAKQGQPMSKDSYKLAFMDVSMANAGDPASGMLLARDLDRRGFKRGVDAALFKAFDAKFNPGDQPSVPQHYTQQFSDEKVSLVDALTEANNRGFWKSQVLGGSTEKGDETTDFNRLVSRELDALDGFVSERVKKGVQYPDAIQEYWEQPRVAKMVHDRDISGMISRATGDGPRASAQSAQGRSIIFNPASTVAQPRMYNIPDADAQLLGLYPDFK
jgi:hypothetical protein